MSELLFDKDFLHKLEYLDLIARRLVFGRQQARRQSVKKGASIEFKDFREYTPGDDPRTVDWSVYARLGELVIKLFRQEEELDLWVLLDTSGSMDFGEPNKFVHARRLAAALAYIGMGNMDSASVTPFHAEIQGGRERLRGRGRHQLPGRFHASRPRDFQQRRGLQLFRHQRYRRPAVHVA